MTNRGALFIDPKLHQQIKIAAAEQGISMKSLTERLLRLGMVAPDVARELRNMTTQIAYDTVDSYDLHCADELLAAYDAALEGESDA